MVAPVERALLPESGMRSVGWVVGTALAAVLLAAGVVDAKPGREPHQPREPRKPKKPREPRPPRRPQTPEPPPTAIEGNQLWEPVGAVPLPGRGLTLAWAPDGHAVAVGGRFRDKPTRLRYDTRIVDVTAQRLVKSFSCHFFWVVGLDWDANPYLGDVIADGGGDHAVKVWNADGPGSTKCEPGQMKEADGGLRQLGQINGWTMALAFSPDGRWLAGASRDRTVRVWQVEPGAHQWKVVALWYDAGAGNFFSMAWAPDGRALALGDRRGRIQVWDVDMDADAWDAKTIDEFARTAYGGQQGWINRHAELTTRTPRWLDGGHKLSWSVRWAPDGSAVAGVGTDGLLSVFEAETGAVRFRSQAPKRTALHGLDWHPDGTTLAVGAADHHVYLFDATTGDLVDRLDAHADLVSAVAWSPDGEMLASTAGGPVLSQALHESTTGPDLNVRLWRRR